MQGEKKQFGSLLKASIPNLFRHTVIRVAGSEGGGGGREFDNSIPSNNELDVGKAGDFPLATVSVSNDFREPGVHGLERGGSRAGKLVIERQTCAENFLLEVSKLKSSSVCEMNPNLVGSDQPESCVVAVTTQEQLDVSVRDLPKLDSRENGSPMDESSLQTDLEGDRTF